jgi:hypothetical protein
MVIRSQASSTEVEGSETTGGKVPYNYQQELRNLILKGKNKIMR